MNIITQNELKIKPQIWIQTGVKGNQMHTLTDDPTRNPLPTLSGLASVIREAYKRTSKKQALYFIAGRLNEGKRANDQLATRTLVPVDIDEFPTDTRPSDVIAKAKAAGYSFIAYPTPSNTDDKPRYRFVFELSREVTREDWAITYKAAADILCVVADNHGETWAQLAGLPITGRYSAPDDLVYFEGKPLEPVKTHQTTKTPATVRENAPEWAWDVPNGVDPLAMVEAWASKQDLQGGESWLPARLEINNACDAGYISESDRETMLEIISDGNPEWLDKNTRATDNKTARRSFAEFFRIGLPEGIRPLSDKGAKNYNPIDVKHYNQKTNQTQNEVTSHYEALKVNGKFDKGDSRLTYAVLDTMLNRKALPFRLVTDSISEQPIIIDKRGVRATNPDEILTQYGRLLKIEAANNGFVPAKGTWLDGINEYSQDHEANPWLDQIARRAKEMRENGEIPDYERYFIDMGADDTPLNRKLGGMWLRALICQGGLDRENSAEFIMILTGLGNSGKSTAFKILALNCEWLYQKPTTITPEKQGDFSTASKFIKGLIMNFDDNESVLAKGSELDMKSLLSDGTKELETKYHPARTVASHWVYACATNDPTPLQDITSARKYVIMSTNNGLNGRALATLTKGFEIDPDGLYSIGDLASMMNRRDLTRNEREYALDTLAAAYNDIQTNGARVKVDNATAHEMAQAAGDFTQTDPVADLVNDYLAKTLEDQPQATAVTWEAIKHYVKVNAGLSLKDQQAAVTSAQKLVKGADRIPGWKWAQKGGHGEGAGRKYFKRTDSHGKALPFVLATEDTNRNDLPL